MKNFVSIFLNLGTVVFAVAAVFALVNYLTGWKLGIKGAAVPGDPLIAVVAVVFAGIFWALARKFIVRDKTI